LCGYFLHELGAYAQAEPLLLEAAQLATRMGSGNDLSYAQLNLGSCYLRQDRFAEAERMLSLGLQGYQRLAIVSFQGEALGHLAEAQRARGELERARQTAERALQLESLDPAPTALALARLSAIDLSQGLIDDALEHASSAQLLVQEHGVTEFVGLIAKSHVESLEARGQSEQARAALRAAVSFIEEQAAKLDDEGARRSFMEQVPEHAHLLRLAASVWFCHSFA
jgi:tetratricopeptide (TPR) repeat protein